MIMKKVILFGAHTANAQISDGNIIVGGNFADFNADFKNKTSLTLTPKAAWFVQDGLAIGAYGNFGFEHINGGQTTYTYGIGPMARYYLMNDMVGKTQKVGFFFEANTGFEGSNKKGKTINEGRLDESRLSGLTTNGLGFGVGPGVSYFVTPNIGLEAVIKYNGIIGFGSEAYADKLTVGIGFQVYLPGSKAKKALKDF